MCGKLTKPLDTNLHENGKICTLMVNRQQFSEVVGAIGFEPTTYGTQNRRATRLRYAPTAHRLAMLFGIEKPKACFFLVTWQSGVFSDGWMLQNIAFSHA